MGTVVSSPSSAGAGSEEEAEEAEKEVLERLEEEWEAAGLCRAAATAAAAAAAAGAEAAAAAAAAGAALAEMRAILPWASSRSQGPEGRGAGGGREKKLSSCPCTAELGQTRVRPSRRRGEKGGAGRLMSGGLLLCAVQRPRFRRGEASGGEGEAATACAERGRTNFALI
jgi:hypothetical protein